MLKTLENCSILSSTSNSKICCSADPLQLVSRNRSDVGKPAHEFEHSRLTDLSAPHTFFVRFQCAIVPFNENTLF